MTTTADLNSAGCTLGTAEGWHTTSVATATSSLGSAGAASQQSSTLQRLGGTTHTWAARLGCASTWGPMS
eukprot:365643-Chlamydomonas_euryale.AAC.20